MANVQEDPVRPEGMRYEGLALALATIAVIGILGLYVHERGLEENSEPLYDWQISAFSTLVGADQAIYNALYTAKDDIPLIYEQINSSNAPGVKFRWPHLDDLQGAQLPPFNEDRSWQQNGSIRWSLFEPLAEGEMQGSAMYLGTDGSLPQQGSFLLVIGHAHAGITNTNAIVVWWNAKNHVDMPQSGFRDALILQGWREVIPHSGAKEVKRIFGNDDSQSISAEDQKAADQLTKELFGE